MVRIYCEKHRRITNGWTKINSDVFKANCGCEWQKHEIENIKVKSVIRYILSDGREVVRESPYIQNPKWKIKEVQ